MKLKIVFRAPVAFAAFKVSRSARSRRVRARPPRTRRLR